VRVWLGLDYVKRVQIDAIHPRPEHAEAGPDRNVFVFRLTDRGQQLEAVVHQLGRWGAPLMVEPAADDAFRTHWLSLPLKVHLTDQAPDRPPITIEVRTGDESMIIETVDGAVRTRPGSAEDPDAVLTGTPQLIVGVLTGKLDLAEARARGLQYDGDPETLRRVQPQALAGA
jgi:hypothetical protein